MNRLDRVVAAYNVLEHVVSVGVSHDRLQHVAVRGKEIHLNALRRRLRSRVVRVAREAETGDFKGVTILAALDRILFGKRDLVVNKPDSASHSEGLRRDVPALLRGNSERILALHGNTRNERATMSYIGMKK